MKRKDKDFNQYMGSVKVGPKGQIVIPKEVREMFKIECGDTLLLMADTRKGIAIQQHSIMAKIADAIFAGKANEINPDENEENMKSFASNVQKVINGEDDDSDNDDVINDNE